MTYEKIFSDVQNSFKKAKLSDFTREFAFQFNITGEGEGIFYAAYKNGILSVEPYDYKDRDVIFTADGKTLIAIATGKLEPIDAEKEGKLSVEGNRDAANELMLLINREKMAEKKPAAKAPEAKEETKKAEKKASPKPAAKTTPVTEKTAVKAETKAQNPDPEIKPVSNSECLSVSKASKPPYKAKKKK